MLYIVATPIGNLEDITLRALRVLREADYIAAEDTRHTRKLLSHYGIKTKLVSFHEHSDNYKTERVIESLLSGANVALVSDAGTPLISDPGLRLVKNAINKGIPITSVPGACAAVSAFVLSGMTAPFCFVGFLSKRRAERLEQIKRIAGCDVACVIYVSPYALAQTLAELYESAGAQRQVVIAKELTKIYEYVFYGNLEKARQTFVENIKGEYVIVVEKNKKIETVTDEQIIEEIKMLLETGMTKKDAAYAASVKFGINKNKAYRLMLQ